MRRLLRWIGNVASIAYGGSGLVDMGDPGLVLPQADDSAPRWITRVAVLTPLVILVLILIGLPWPVVAVVAAMLLLPLVLNRIGVMRRR